MTDPFKPSQEKQAYKEALDKIDHQIDVMRNIAQDPRASLKTRTSLDDLNWEREKIMEKLKSLS